MVRTIKIRYRYLWLVEPEWLTPNHLENFRKPRKCENMNSKRCICVASVALVAGLAGQAHASLGTFSPANGYQIVQPWVDVSYFNSGQYGPNAGGGSLSHVPADSGLWKVTGSVGGIYTTAAARNAAITADPTYLNPPPVGGSAPVYIVGNHGPFRNDTPAGTGAAKYDYTLDTYDSGGVAPASVTSGLVSAGFYFCPNPADPITPGRLPRDKFAMSFKDAANNTGLQWGYAADNEVYWRTNTSGPWTYTGVYANAANWDGVKVIIDLTAGTFGLDYYVVSTNTWQNMVAAGTLLGTPMTNFTTLGWQLEDNVFSGVGGKNFFDDFSIAIPSPSAAALLGLGGLLAARRRR